MARPNAIRTAPRNGTSYAAGRHLHKHGPLTERELFAAIPFGSRCTRAEDVLQRALTSGWLSLLPDGRIGISSFARAHYDQLSGEAERPVGQIATVRTPTDVFARPPLSRKYMPNPRGTRQDIPAWSVRAPGLIFHKA